MGVEMEKKESPKMIPTAKQYALLNYQDRKRIVKTLKNLLVRYAETEHTNND